MTKRKQESVMLGTKHDAKPPRKARSLADHPAMKELSRMIEAGEVKPDRTLAYLKTKGKR